MISTEVQIPTEIKDFEQIQQSLPELADLINQSHLQVQRAFQGALVVAHEYLNKERTAGEYLLTAKSQLKHGQWLPWLKDNCPEISERTAQRYMLVVRDWDKITDKLRNVNKNDTVSDLGITAALRLLEGTNEHIEEGEPIETEVVTAEIVEPLPPSPKRRSTHGSIVASQEPQTTEQPATTHGLIPGAIARVIAKDAKDDLENSNLYGKEVQINKIHRKWFIVCTTLDSGMRVSLREEDLEILPKNSPSRLVQKITEDLGLDDDLAINLIARIFEDRRAVMDLSDELCEEVFEMVDDLPPSEMKEEILELVNEWREE